MSQTQPSVMIVDDLVANLTLLTDILKGHGLKVRPATSGRQALDAARHTPPDLVLLDINMPEMDGYEVCRIFKATPALAEIPILFISALDDTTDKVRALREGGQDYITKPFQVEEVLARIQTHLELRRARQVLEDRNAALEKALDQLEKAQSRLIQAEKMAALGVMAAGVAHEINNPVNFIKTSCHGLRQDMRDVLAIMDFCADRVPDSSRPAVTEFKKSMDHETLIREIPALFDSIDQGLARVVDIVKSLGTFARSDETISREIDLREVMDAVLIMLRGRDKKNVRIEKRYGPVPLVTGNAGKLSQVFMNILTNAMDSLEDSGPDAVIAITTGEDLRDQNRYGVLRVTDSGPGMPPDVLGRIFDPFFTTKPVGQGTGLGLFICANLIAEHHGLIEVDSAPGSGSTFSILVPAGTEASC